MATRVRDRRAPEVRYAEDQLGIRSLWIDAQDAQADLDKALYLLSDQEIQLRNEEAALAAIENDLLISIHMRGVESGASIAAQDREYKVSLAQHDGARVIRDTINTIRNHISQQSAEIRQLEIKHRGLVAQMKVVGGYLEYLAASKNARTAAVDAAVIVP